MQPIPSPAEWIYLSKFVTENQRPIEFMDHRFMIEPLSDDSDDIVGRKSAQVGWSVTEILRSIYSAKYEDRNIGYILPTRNVVDDFVKPKVNPLIGSNKTITDIVHDDSIGLKRIGKRFLYFKGAFSETAAISFSIDTLILDEYDRMPNMSVVNMFDSRLQAAVHPKRRRFSNPSQIGYGVDGLYNDSDQRHWFIKCHHCNHYWYIDFEMGDKAHYVNQEKFFFACGKCHKELSDSDRRNGQWVQKYPNRQRHGYWFSQMMAPWVTAKRIMEQKEESSIDFFYNFVLGKAYTPSDMIVNRETILRACAPSNIPKLQVCIGVDQNVSEQIWVAGTPNGIFAHGKAKSWEEIEDLKLRWNATLVLDPNPYPTKPKLLATKYSDVYLCYFKQQDGMSILQWKDHNVYADRTRLLDYVATDITEQRLLFRESPYALEDYIADWANIYRTTVEKEDGRTKSEWLKKEGKNSDYSFATAYCRIGLSRIVGGNADFVDAQFAQTKAPVTDTINDDGRYETTLNSAIAETFEQFD